MTQLKQTQSLKIAVNTRLLLKNKLEGIGWFTFETLRRIVLSNPEVHFYFLFDRKPDPAFLFAPNVVPVVLFPQARHPFLYMIWFEISVTWALRKIKPDLFLSPDGYLSLSTKTPSLPVMHDLNFEHFPKDLPIITSWYYRFFFPRFAKKAIRIATVSLFSKNDIIQQYGIASEKIDVTYNGVNELFIPLDKDQIQKIRNHYSRGEPYFLFVGSLHPRKNLARLFAAFDIFKTTNANEVKLLVVGEKKWWTKDISQAYDSMTHQNEVIFCGRLNIQELTQVTASALAITYVSYFEGFGIPIIEAFRCEVPVITSNVTSMPEIAADAALLIDPFNSEDIAQAMLMVWENPAIRQQMIQKGIIQAKQFSWDITAERLWSAILRSI